MASDPYAAPKARVEDVREAHEAAEFVAGGQSVPAGRAVLFPRRFVPGARSDRILTTASLDLLTGGGMP